MKLEGGRKRGGRGSRGSSMVYVMFLVALLSIFSCGYMAASSYNMKAAIASNHYMEAQLTAKTIHTSFCEAVSSGHSPAMNYLWELFEEDMERVRQEYDEIMEEEAAEEDGLETERAAEKDEEKDREPEDEDSFERYLRQALGHKEYAIRGASSGEDENAPKLEIILKTKPLEETAYVHTKVTCNGYHFSMKADIVFDNSDGAVIAPVRSRSRAFWKAGKVYLEGNGVYRYYEDEDSRSQ